MINKPNTPINFDAIFKIIDFWIFAVERNTATNEMTTWKRFAWNKYEQFGEAIEYEIRIAF